MRSPEEESYLLKAIDAFRRRLIVVSPDFTVLASGVSTDGVEVSDIIGRKCHMILYDRDDPCPDCAVMTASESGRPVLRTKLRESIDLDHVPCLYSYPIYNQDRIEAFVSMDFDLPTGGGLEEMLQRSNAFLLNLIRSSIDGVIAADKAGKILVFNDAAAQITGHSEEAALNRLTILDIYPNNDAYDVMQKMRSEDFGGRGKLKGYQVDVLGMDGSRIPISLNAAIVYEKRKEAATIGFFHDLREELRIKEELQKTQLQLLQSEKMASLGKLAAGVAHQLNNPLAGITLFTKLVLEEYALPEDAQSDLHRILKDAERCRDTVKELLEFTRQTRHLMRPNDLNQALERALFLLKNQPLFQNITIVEEFDAHLPLVQVDIQQINHLLMNIILNAAQAMEGKGDLRISTTYLAKKGMALINISDTGPGIPADILPHIFEPFFTTKEEGQGTGLGLSLAYSIVENHGGVIKAENRPTQGTTFTIELPLSTADSGGLNGADRE